MAIRPGVASLRIQDTVTLNGSTDMSSATGLTCYLDDPQGNRLTQSGTWVTTAAAGIAEAYFADAINKTSQIQYWTAQFYYDGVAAGEPKRFAVHPNMTGVPP